MASRVLMPKLTDTMEEGVVLRWYKHEGDSVESGDALAEIETDKAVMDLEAYASGVVRKVLVSEGARVPAGGLIAVIGREDEKIDDLLSQEPAGVAKPAAAPSGPAAKSAQPTAPAAPPKGVVPGERAGLKSSPLARKMAAELDVDLSAVEGTGPGGRITRADVERAAGGERAAEKPARARPEPVAATQPPAVPGQEVELSTIRRTIARKMIQSKAPVPHFYVTIDLKMDRCLDLRAQLQEAWGDEAPSLTAMLLKACAVALQQEPGVNASFLDERIRLHREVNIGIAVGLEDGLIVAVLRNCEKKGLRQIGIEAADLIRRARTRKLRPEEFTGATFSVSNLGMFEVESFSAIITPPEAAVLAVGSVREEPVLREGAVASTRMMRVTLSSDHRVIDGVLAARYLQALREFIEQPFRLLTEEGGSDPQGKASAAHV